MPTPTALLASPKARTREQVARLFHRAAFGATAGEIEQWAAKGYEATVDHLLSFTSSATRTDALGGGALGAGVAPFDGIGGGEVTVESAQRWWLNRMATTSYPLEEKLTLYWHGHFATAASKVHHTSYMLRQNSLLRGHAAGNFRELCNALTPDAAMLLWLDGNDNQRNELNENYGREFMELFTLGRDRYTQPDVVEAARAFSGYRVDGAGRVTFHKDLHDDGVKTFLGQRGKWGATDITDIVLDRHPDGPVAARYVARRMAAFFHHPDPEPAVVDAMAASFRAGNRYDIRAMVRTLLLRPEFADGSRLTIKSPAEVVASAARGLGLARRGLDTADLDQLAQACSAMGQQLFNPPDVSGWKGGATWANTATVLARYNFAALAASYVDSDVTQRALDGASGVPEATAKPWMDRLGILALSPSTQRAIDEYFTRPPDKKADDATLSRGVITLLLASPEFNLR
jgi:uncharacterized protein (DUF1800 family)